MRFAHTLLIVGLLFLSNGVIAQSSGYAFYMAEGQKAFENESFNKSSDSNSGKNKPSEKKSVLTYSNNTDEQKIIAIGASTGGTEAIKNILTQLPANTPPVLITQHMPANFTQAFAHRLNKISSMITLFLNELIFECLQNS